MCNGEVGVVDCLPVDFDLLDEIRWPRGIGVTRQVIRALQPEVTRPGVLLGVAGIPVEVLAARVLCRGYC